MSSEIYSYRAAPAITKLDETASSRKTTAKSATMPWSPKLSRGLMPGRLSSSILWLTVLFVILSEVLLFVPALTAFCSHWIADRLGSAKLSATLIDRSEKIFPGFQEILLKATKSYTVAADDGKRRRLLAMRGVPRQVKMVVHVQNDPLFPKRFLNSLQLMINAPDAVRVVRRFDDYPPMEMEAVMIGEEIQTALRNFSLFFFVSSALICVVLVGVVSISLRVKIILPLKKIFQQMEKFSNSPFDSSNIAETSDRPDEIGDLERHLQMLQESSNKALLHQSQLANLGMAVSKINHDMRNILAAAHLFSQSLSEIPDPRARKAVPKIIAALDRAVAYTRSVMVYGGPNEAQPRRRPIILREMVDDISAMLNLTESSAINFENKVDAGVTVVADPDQMYRILSNLCRNSMQALQDDYNAPLVRTITVESSQDDKQVRIKVSDTGPGIPIDRYDTLFKPFQQSTKAGGTGLGLAISAELTRAHGGRLELIKQSGPGAVFEICLPHVDPSGKAQTNSDQKHQYYTKAG